MIERGDAVIVNDLDRPCTRYIAIVTAVVDDHLFEADYLAVHCKGGPHLKQRLETATRIEWFGRRLVSFMIDNHRFVQAVHDPNYASVATYPDGGSREWQPDTDEATLVRDDVYGLWAAYQKLATELVPDDGKEGSVYYRGHVFPRRYLLNSRAECTHPNRYQEWAMQFSILGRGETEDDARKSIFFTDWKAVPGRPVTMDEVLRENQTPGTKRRWYCPECGEEGPFENVEEQQTCSTQS